VAQHNEKPLDAGGGTLAVLRRGFTDAPVKFRMAQFKPATGLNPLTSADYGRNGKFDARNHGSKS
jgi:type I restriction enzyme, R subunit